MVSDSADFADMRGHPAFKGYEPVRIPPFTVPPHLGWLKMLPGLYPAFNQGDCMEPELHDRSILFLDPNTPPRPGDLVGLFLKEGLIIKRFLGTSEQGHKVANNNPPTWGHLPAATKMHRVVAWFRPDKAAGLTPDHQD